MDRLCILSDFDGTITKKDGLYTFIETHAVSGWQTIEQDWVAGKISSKQCLTEELNMVPDISEALISEFVKNIDIDEYFSDFYNNIRQKNIDFYIVSDGIDYFINKILERYGLKNINVISNHGDFKNGKFEINFPNDYQKCKNNAGTCKCKVISDLKNKYDKIIYIGDGISDFCVADKADVLYAKKKLLKYCEEKEIKFIPYDTFKDIYISIFHE